MFFFLPVFFLNFSFFEFKFYLKFLGIGASPASLMMHSPNPMQQQQQQLLHHQQRSASAQLMAMQQQQQQMSQQPRKDDDQHKGVAVVVGLQQLLQGKLAKASLFALLIQV